MIPAEECKNGYLYKVHARNFGLGVYSEKDKGFIGIRYKFGDRFLDMEYHHGTGAPYGTVSPDSEICKIPDGIDIEVFILHPLGRLWRDGRPVGRRDLVEGEAPHGTRMGFEDRFVDTGERLPDKVYPRLMENAPLFEWLNEIEETLANEKKM
jgi:hypothetical protein